MDKTRAKFDPKRAVLGWKILGGAFALWIVGLFLNPMTFQMSLQTGMVIRLRILLVVAIAQLALAIVGAVMLLPTVRRRRLRVWAIVLLVAVVAMTSMFHLLWVSRLFV